MAHDGTDYRMGAAHSVTADCVQPSLWPNCATKQRRSEDQRAAQDAAQSPHIRPRVVAAERLTRKSEIQLRAKAACTGSQGLKVMCEHQ